VPTAPHLRKQDGLENNGYKVKVATEKRFSSSSNKTRVEFYLPFDYIRISGIETDYVLQMKEAARVDGGKLDGHRARRTAQDAAGNPDGEFAANAIEKNPDLTGGTRSQVLGHGEKSTADAEVVDFSYRVDFLVYRYFSIDLKRNTAETPFFL